MGLIASLAPIKMLTPLLRIIPSFWAEKPILVRPASDILFYVASLLLTHGTCGQSAQEISLSPYHKNIKGAVQRNTLTFRVSEPEMLMITANDYKPLCLFQTPPETDIPIEILVEKTRYSNSTGFWDERGHIDGLYFDNVIASEGEIVLEGFSAEHRIEDVRLVDCYNAGEKIATAETITTNKFVKDVSFSASGSINSDDEREVSDSLPTSKQYLIGNNDIEAIISDEGFLTAWGKENQVASTLNLDGETTDKEQHPDAWEDPLVPAPFQTLALSYGGKKSDNFVKAFSLPLATILQPEQKKSFNLVFSPRDTIVNLEMTTAADGTLKFTRRHDGY